MNGDVPKGYISKWHLIYVASILIIISIGVLAVNVWDSSEAGLTLNNASTATSIVLAVVAIIITLVDVAGQRKTISELFESTETLEHTVSEANEHLIRVRELSDQVESAVETMRDQDEKLREGIERLAEKEGSEEDGKSSKEASKLLKIVEDRQKAYFPSFHTANRENLIEYKLRSKNELIVLQTIKNNFGYNEFTKWDLVSEAKDLIFTKVEMDRAINDLIDKGKLKETKEGHYRLLKE